MRPWGGKRTFRFPSTTDEGVRADVAEEFAFHLDMRTAELVQAGLDHAQARAQAIEEFGDRRAGLRACADIGIHVERRRRAGRYFDEVCQDLTLGLRLLRRSPGFAAVAILTLAIGIGANTAIYSVLDAALLHPLPYPDPDRLVQVVETLENGSPNSVSGGAFLDWRDSQRTFAALALTGRVTCNLRGAGTPERLTGLEVSHDFFRVLGIAPVLGRGFLPGEDRPVGRTDVVVITADLWRSHFGGDPAIVGKTIVLDEVPRTVVGVLPANAWIVRDQVFFIPAVLVPGSERAQRAPHWAAVFGRLQPGVSLAQARAELRAIRQRLAPEYPPFKRGWSVDVLPAADLVGRLTRAPLLILATAVSLVLLVACANVATLLIARGCRRRQELRIRSALGAGRFRLVRQVLTENLALAALGGAGAIVIAAAGIGALRHAAWAVVPLALEPRIDGRVLAFCAAATLASGVLAGLLPALRAFDGTTVGTNVGSRGTAGAGSQRMQSALVLGEIAVTVTLLASAGFLLHSLGKIVSVDPGFDASRVLAVDVSLPASTYASADSRRAFSARLLDRVRRLPSVDAAGTGLALPFSDGGYGEYFRRMGRATDDRVLGRVDYVSPGYLEALGVRLLRGRRLQEGDDRPDAPRVAVISETTARRFFPEGGAVGQLLAVAGEPWEVVGVVTDVAGRALDEPPGAFAYCPEAFSPASSLSVAVRTTLDPMRLLAAVQAEVRQLDGGVALANPRALDRAAASSTARRRIVLALVGLFAVAALALAAIGLYGLMAYSVATRRREFGIRMALGARPNDVVGEVLRRGLRLAAVGLAVGLAGAAVAAQLLASQLFHVPAVDPPVLVGTVVLVGTAAIAASIIPAWRAARIDPAAVLGAE